jgi:two-component system CheB/CheR fusion protein
VVPPTRAGFGSLMIQRVLAAELGGEVNVAFDSSGVVCTFSAPIPAGRDGSESRNLLAGS